MVYVRLERDWTDSNGSTHAAGAMVDVDVSTLARLESQGLVEDPSGSDSGTHSWLHPIASDSGGDGEGGGNDGGGGNGGGGNGGGGSGSGGNGGSGGTGGDSWINPTGGGQTND